VPVRIFIVIVAGFITSQVSLANEIGKSSPATKASATKAPATKSPTKTEAEKEAAKSEDEAISLVNKENDVKQWLSEFKGPNGTNPKTEGRPAWRIEQHYGKIYVVHVLEDLPESQVTFGFYDVNLKTKKVTKHKD
jgi:hypothetical protein